LTSDGAGGPGDVRGIRVLFILVVLLMNRKTAHPAELYVHDVLNGKLPACVYVKQACQRQVEDLRDAGKSWFPYHHDPAEAQRVITFFGFCRPSKGRQWARKPLQLMPWQQFMLWCTYGWLRDVDGLRRFDTAYVEIPRKNGKSTFKAAEGLYLFMADGEPGAEVYVAATKEEQAKEKVWDEAVWMIKRNPELRARCEISQKRIYDPLNASFYRPIGSDSKTQDGHNASGIIVDELHAHKSRKLYDVLETSTDAREQPMKSSITTAGEAPKGICWELRKQIVAILSRAVRKEDMWGVIYTIDENDDPMNEKVWPKANPSLGTLISIDKLRSRADLARQLPSNRLVFLRYQLNVWVEGKVSFITKELWESNDYTIDFNDLAGCDCVCAVDLSSEDDMSAYVLAFELANGRVALLPRVFIPEETIRKRSEKAGVDYEVWRQDGLVVATPGNVIDYGYIERSIQEDGERFNIQEISFDPRNALYLATRLGPEGVGYPIVKHHQSFSQMSPPTKLTQKLFLGRKIVHNEHPVLRWCFMNTVVVTNDYKDLRPSKGDSVEKIDLTTASIMAIGRLFAREKDDQGVDYEGMVTA